MRTTIRLTFIAAALCLSIVGCSKKDNNSTATTTTTTDKDDVQMLATSDQVSTDMEQSFDDGINNAQNGVAVTDGLVLGPCVTVTLTLNGGLKTLTIDYGTIGCLCSDGKTRKGKLIATAANFNQLNVLRTLSTDHYYVNQYHVDGSITRNITHQVDSANRTAEVVENLTVTDTTSNAVFTRSGNLTRIYHYGIPNHPADNTLTTWGQVNVQRPSGVQVVRVVDQSTPLFYKNSCHQIVSGIAHITTSNHNITVDYGSGDCDGVATVSNGTITWTINL
jgi:hypothetical protein